jgi:ABC-2 type transport system permease protein
MRERRWWPWSSRSISRWTWSRDGLTRVQAIVDGSDSNTATIVLGYLETVARTYNQELAIEQAARTSGRTVTVPLDLRPRVWFNADMESKNYIIPGLIAVIMMVIAAMLTSLTVAREWETGTMEQVISTPLKGPELILGKLLPYFGIGMLDVLVAVLMGEFSSRCRCAAMSHSCSAWPPSFWPVRFRSAC